MHEFTERRISRDVYNFDSDAFFETFSSKDAPTAAVIKPAVLNVSIHPPIASQNVFRSRRNLDVVHPFPTLTSIAVGRSPSCTPRLHAIRPQLSSPNPVRHARRGQCGQKRRRPTGSPSARNITGSLPLAARDGKQMPEQCRIR